MSTQEPESESIVHVNRLTFKGLSNEMGWFGYGRT
jgi:hypothetical protein